MVNKKIIGKDQRHTKAFAKLFKRKIRGVLEDA
jgi:hypothetical protein